MCSSDLVIRTMAWYKMNDLHLVINNNYIFHEHYVDNGHDPFKESYAAFRLESIREDLPRKLTAREELAAMASTSAASARVPAILLPQPPE